jgi:hypothetical protein
MKKTFLASIFVFALVLPVLGCGGDENTLSQEEAGQAFASLSQATTSVEAAAREASLEISDNEISATVTCLNGGFASVAGIFDSNESFSLSVEFNSCTETNITIDGSLDYAATVTENGITTIMDGSLSFSGAVEGNCTIDVITTINDASVSVDGSVCGQNVDVSVDGQ